MALSRRENRNSPEVVTELFENNKGVVGEVIRLRFREHRESFEDLFDAGLHGLWRAAELFDDTKGFRFTTYAFRAIACSIATFIHENGAQPKSVQYGVEHEEAVPSFVEQEEATRHLKFVKDAVSELLEVLEPRRREVVRRRMNGESYDSIAESLGVTKQCIHQTVKFAHNKFRTRLDIGRKFRESLQRVG